MGISSEKRLYPVFLDVEGRLAILVGGDASMERKAKALTACGADVVIVASEVTPGIAAMEEAERVTVERRGYVRGDLAGARVVFVSGQSAEVEAAVRDEAAEGQLVHVMGSPELCDFVTPSVVRRGPLQIAVSSSGASPQVARRVKAEIAETYGPEWAEYVALLGEVRTLVMQRMVGGDEARGPVLEALAEADLLQRIRDGKTPTAEQVYEELVPKD